MGVELITQYFPDITETQKDLFIRLEPLYAEWNAKINVISRKDFEHFYERHVLHSLAIAKVQPFAKGTTVLDIGTGGGFPGIPLAIMFPYTQFTLVDSIQKKINVVNAVIEGLGITNAKAVWDRTENIPGNFDYAVTRAVAPTESLLAWVNIPLQPKKGKAVTYKIKQSLLCLKGGDLEEELENVFWPVNEYPITKLFKPEFFETKKVVEIKFTT